MAEAAELWDCLEASWEDEEPWEVADFRENLKELGALEEHCFRRGAGSFEKGDPVLGPVPPGFIDRTTFAFIELDKKYGVLASSPYGSPAWFGDVEGGAGGWVEGLCYTANNAHNLTGLSGIGMSCSRSRLEESNTTRFLPKTFYFTGADTTGDSREPSNIKAFAGAVQQRTKGVGLQVLLGAEQAGKGIRGKRAYATARLVIAMLVVAKGGGFILHLPDITSTFSHSVLYILRLTFERVHLTWPRILRPTPTSSVYVVALNKADPPTFSPNHPPHPLTSFLSKACTVLSGPSGEVIHSLVSKAAMEEETFHAWLRTEVSSILRERKSLLTEVRNGGDARQELRPEAVISRYYEEIGLKSTIPASLLLPTTPGKRSAFNNMSYYPPAKK